MCAKQAYSAGGNLPLPLKTYVELDLPGHLYVEALAAGSFRQDNWSHLLLHSSALLHMGLSRGNDRLKEVASNCIWLLKRLANGYTTTGKWSATEHEIKLLGLYLTEAGWHYRQIPRGKVHESRQIAAERVVAIAGEVLAGDVAIDKLTQPDTRGFSTQ